MTGEAALFFRLYQCHDLAICGLFQISLTESVVEHSNLGSTGVPDRKMIVAMGGGISKV